MSANLSPIAEMEYGIERITGIHPKIEFYSLTKFEKNAAIITVALAALTAIEGIAFLAGVGSIGATAAWAMIGGGAGGALLVSIPLAIRHCVFKVETAHYDFAEITRSFNPSNKAQRVWDMSLWRSDDVTCVFTNDNILVIFTKNKKIEEQINNFYKKKYKSDETQS